MTTEEKMQMMEALVKGGASIGQLIIENSGTITYHDNRGCGEQQKKEEEAPKDKKTAIMEYVDRLKPVVQERVLPVYDQVWMEILELDEVRSEVYNRGRQKGTAFNRDFVARIIHMMSMKGVVSGSDSRLTELLEPEKGKSHPVRGSLGLVPERNVKRAVEGVFQKYELKVSES